jgi:hypothetical protein
VAYCCEDGNEHMGSIGAGNFLAGPLLYEFCGILYVYLWGVCVCVRARDSVHAWMRCIA